jgi:hypothetical protein
MSIVFDFSDLNQRLLGDDWWQPRAPKPKQVELPAVVGSALPACVPPGPPQATWRMRNVPAPIPVEQDVARIWGARNVPPPVMEPGRLTVQKLLDMSDEDFARLVDRVDPAVLCRLMGGEPGKDLVVGTDICE